ncbi:MAG: fused MFS/spermidine synthase [Syntrophobacteraceae bacterium]
MLEIVVFSCGAVVMILEMVGSRILAPYLGSSIIVWTSLIGIILGSLSIGYWWGGVRADRDPKYRSLSLIILIAAFFIAVVAVAKSFVLSFLQDHVASVHLASAVATMVLFAPPSILLGMVSPYAVKLKLISLEKSGNTVGRLYAISTVGSIAGTFLGGFYLIALLGSTNILFVLSVSLVIISFAAYRGNTLVKLASLALFIVLMIASASYERYQASLGLHDIDTNYNRIVIYEGKDFLSGTIRAMTTHPRAMQSAVRVDAPTELILPYTKFFHLASCLKPDLSSFLILGGGGYSFPKNALVTYPNATIDVVEIDPQVTALAAKYFFLKEDPRLRIFHEDARAFLHGPRGKYDAILVDVFNSHYSIPFHLTTRQTVELIREKLSDDGVVIVNTLSAIEGKGGRFLRAEYATYQSVFKNVWLLPVSKPDDGTAWQNVMLVAMKSDGELSCRGDSPQCPEFFRHLWTNPVIPEFPPLTDDYAPVDSLLF